MMKRLIAVLLILGCMVNLFSDSYSVDEVYISADLPYNSIVLAKGQLSFNYSAATVNGYSVFQPDAIVLVPSSLASGTYSINLEEIETSGIKNNGALYNIVNTELYILSNDYSHPYLLSSYDEVILVMETDTSGYFFIK